MNHVILIKGGQPDRPFLRPPETGLQSKTRSVSVTGPVFFWICCDNDGTINFLRHPGGYELMTRIEVKICGVKTEEALIAAAKSGAAYVGFNFYRPSPRYVTPEQAAVLARQIPPGTKAVAVTADADDALFEEIFQHFRPDFIQLHGSESAQRAAELRAKWKTRIIRAIPIDSAASLEAVKPHEETADYFLFDAAPPKGAILPGGNAVRFDWKLLQGQNFAKPWFLSGGLRVDNLGEAIALSGATRVDLSSGVESAPGEKDPVLIEELLRTL